MHHPEPEAELLRALRNGVRPRPFAVYELTSEDGEVVDADVCAWGLDISGECPSVQVPPGAVFVGPGGLKGDADSAERVRAMFEIVGDVRLVWL